MSRRYYMWRSNGKMRAYWTFILILHLIVTYTLSATRFYENYYYYYFHVHLNDAGIMNKTTVQYQPSYLHRWCMLGTLPGRLHHHDPRMLEPSPPNPWLTCQISAVTFDTFLWYDYISHELVTNLWHVNRPQKIKVTKCWWHGTFWVQRILQLISALLTSFSHINGTFWDSHFPY